MNKKATADSATMRNWLFFFIFANLIIMFADVFTNGSMLFDSFEHLRASFFVSQGEVPYRDFFEHHHPLLWFMFALPVSVFPHHALAAFYAARLISFVAALGCFYFVYLIGKKFLGGKDVGLTAVFLLFTGVNISVALVSFKPDVFMYLTFLSGLYSLFSYYQTEKRYFLINAGILFSLSFLFLQTAALLLAPCTISALCFLYYRKEKWRDYAVAVIVPLLLLSGFIFYLCATGSLTAYFELNWLFNSKVASLLGADSEWVLLVHADLYVLFGLSLYFFFANKQNNIITSTLLGLSLLTFLQIFLVHSQSSRHNVVFVLCFALFTAGTINTYSRKFKFFFCLWAVFHLIANITFFCIAYDFSFFKKIAEIDNRYEEKFLAGGNVGFRFYQPHEHYFWQYLAVEEIYSVIFQRFGDYDFQKTFITPNVKVLILENHVSPRFIFLASGEKYLLKSTLPLKLSEFNNTHGILWERKDGK